MWHRGTSVDAEIKNKTEVGEIAVAFNEAINGMRSIIKKVKDMLQNINSGAGVVEEVGAKVKENTDIQAESLNQTSQTIDEFHNSIKTVSENLNIMSQLAEDTSSSILQMASSIEEVDSNVENLTVSVGDTSSSIEEISASLREVAGAIDDLSVNADETVSSLAEIDVSISNIEETASNNAKLSQEVAKEGEMGLKVVEKTHEGMEKIKQAVSSIADIINMLGKSSEEIGDILTVIDEVAEETNLLALNAAILAAQAGEYGKGFGVVAEEIRELAERTSSSTKEIETLIKAVQSHTQKAVVSVKDGIEKVDEGEKLSQETISTLKAILERFNQSQDMSLLIANSTKEQAQGSKLVTQNLQKITDTIHQIARATQEQSQGSRQITHAVERMKDLTSQIKRATQEQTKGSKIITSNTEKVASSAQNIKDSVSLQKEGFSMIIDAVNANKKLMKKNQEGVEKLNFVVSEIKAGVGALNREVDRFKLEGGKQESIFDETVYEEG